MTKTIEAVYEKGILRPLSPIKGLRSRQKVHITLDTVLKKKHPLAGLCGTLPDKDAAEMMRVIEDEFEKVDMGEW
ncbi:MAG: antitoxin family protein [Thermodesulfovibrionales bacterium]|jgi:predicted DNA-binding antitoxin AbrB/MazE fold protein